MSEPDDFQLVSDLIDEITAAQEAINENDGQLLEVWDVEAISG